MQDEIYYHVASEFPLEAMADLYTRTFAEYFVPARITVEELARIIRVEQVDLTRSPVQSVGPTQTGMATLALRGTHAHVRGFGVAVAYRGRGLSHGLFQECIEQARRAGAVELSLGVMIKNERAVRAYRAGGMQVDRELSTVEWHGPNGPASSPPENRVVAARPDDLLEHFQRLHTVPATWNRDLFSLREIADLKGLAIIEDGRPCAYILYSTGVDGRAEILDIAAVSVQDATALLKTLQVRFSDLICNNEPVESPALPALHACGFVETIRRYAMRMDLKDKSC